MARNIRPLMLLLFSAAVLMAANLCAAQTYTLTEIPISPTAINNSGQIGGQDTNGDPAILNSNGTVTDLGNFGSSCSVYGCRAYAISSLGDAAGLTGDGNDGYKPFLFSNGALTELPNGGTPQGINSSDSVVGYFSPTACESLDTTHAFVVRGGAFTDLGQSIQVPGQSCVLSEALSINTSGQIAGAAENPSNTSLAREASVWQTDGTVSFLGVLGAGFESRAFAINDAGQVTGSSYTGDSQGSEHAFLFNNGQMTDIDTLGSIVSRGYAINSNGVVVGAAAAPNQPGIDYHAFVSMFGSMMDLNKLIPTGSGLTVYQANGINDAGQIVAFAQSDSDGSVHGVLLNPVPPQVTSISPTSGIAGTLVTISGSHFTSKPKACSVTINGKLAKWTTWSNSKITVKVPTGATSGKVVVSAFFQHSNGVAFTVK